MLTHSATFRIVARSGMCEHFVDRSVDFVPFKPHANLPVD